MKREAHNSQSIKKKWFTTGFLLLLFVAGNQLHAQQSDADRNLFEDMKAKAEKGDAMAQCVLAEIYDGGETVTKNYAEAAKWFRKAAEQGNPEAQFNLGNYYLQGNAVAKDDIEAVKWFRKAADQNYSDAQNNLGTRYDKGEGVAKDEAEAAKWYRKAADQGNAQAQDNLGFCYGIGQGMAKDDATALKWYRKSAEQGCAEGQNNLGFCYANGQGVAKDYVEAYKWFLLAAGQGNKSAKKGVDALEHYMTKEQIAEGQNLAHIFKPNKEFSPNNTALLENPSFTGTGFFITDDGYFVSNFHVVKNAAKVRVVTGAGLIDATVVKIDSANDLALLKTVGQFAPMPIAASRTVKLGGTVATVGFPDIGLQGFAPKLAKGEIASLSGAADDPRYFQISVPVQPGNSGGALVDAHGNVVGIVAAKLDATAALEASGALPENVNYAVKSSLLLSFLESVPDVANKLKEPNSKDEPFEDAVQSAEHATVLVLVY